MGYNLNAMCYYQSALDLHLTTKLYPEIDGFELILGNRHYFFSGVLTPFNNSTSGAISQNKYQTNAILSKNNIPVPKGRVIHIDEYKNEDLESIIASLDFPLVLKPVNGYLGQDVLCDIRTIDKLRQLLDIYLPRYNYLLIEEFQGNLNSYRVLVFKRQILGVMHNIQAQIIGDGEHTIQELIDLTNSKRSPVNLFLNFGHIKVDEECLIQLSNQGVTLDFIPAVNQKVFLGYTRRGGTYEAISTKICKKNKKLMLRVAKVVGLNLVGIDVACENINTPIEHSRGFIIETNHNPNIKKHEMPEKGKASRVSMKIMRSLIYRHPSVWLSLFFNAKPATFYLRGFITVVAIMLIVYFVRSLS